MHFTSVPYDHNGAAHQHLHVRVNTYIYGTNMGTLYLKEDPRERVLSIVTLMVEFVHKNSLKLFITVGFTLAISFRDGLNGRIRYICTGVAGGGVSTTRGGTRGNGGRQGPRLLTGWRG